MHIAIDISPLSGGHQYRGIGAYTKLLVAALQKVDHENSYSLVSAGEKILADVVHYPYFDFFFLTLPWRRTQPTVVTVHDTIPLIYPEAYLRGVRGGLKFAWQKHLLSQVDAVITDSQQSQQDVVVHLRVKPHKTRVVYLAADAQFAPVSVSIKKAILKKYRLTKPYFLYVGDINYNKNLPALITAFSRVAGDYELVLVSRALTRANPAAQSLWTLIDSLSVADRLRILTDVPLEPLDDMRGLYSGALWYVQPSLYEGFGLPVLEAMACSCPVISTLCGSLKEVVGTAALTVASPTSESLQETLTIAATMSKPGREVWAEKGRRRAADFSWEQTALATISVYQSVV